MTADEQQERTIGQALDWANVMLDYTDRVCRSIAAEELDARFTDPGGAFFFSARELMMHMADTRWNVLKWISGVETEDRIFQREFGGHEKPWRFKDDVTRDEILASLADSRAEITKLMESPASAALASTDSLRQMHEARQKKLKEQRPDDAEPVLQGPSVVANMLLFMVAHEQAHRGELQWLMRSRGAHVFRYI